MSFGWNASPADRRLLEEGRLTGPMPWIIAIMMFLTAIAAACGLALDNGAERLDARLSGRLTVQVIDADGERRARDADRLARLLPGVPGVTAVRMADRAELAELLRPWLGDDGLDGDLPIPALIDVDLVRSDDETVAAVEQAVRSAVPDARIDRHAAWLAPIASLFGWLTLLTLAMILLMAGATAAAVVLAARGALDTHRTTIDVLHQMGATDGQVARLFQRRIALDALFGGSIGLAAALVVVALIGWRVADLGSELAAGAALDWRDWLRILLLPPLFSLLAMAAARVTVTRAIGRVL